MAGDAESHGEQLLSASHRHFLHISVAIAAHFLDRTVQLKNKSLDMALMAETNKIRKIMDFLPGNGLLGIPVFEQFLDARLISHRFDALMAAYAFLHWGDSRH